MPENTVWARLAEALGAVEALHAEDPAAMVLLEAAAAKLVEAREHVARAQDEERNNTGNHGCHCTAGPWEAHRSWCRERKEDENGL